eukprot:scaffold23.g4190.t1
MRALAALEEARLGGARGLAVLAHRGGGTGLHPVVTQATNLRLAVLPPAAAVAQAAHGGLPPQQQQRRGVFIQTQPTPNPSSLIFVPGKPVAEGGGTRAFDSAREAMASPLAKRLFQIDGVTKVFFGSDFVTVTKSEDYAWSVLKPDVFAAIMDHYTSGEPLFYDAAEAGAAEHLISEHDDEASWGGGNDQGAAGDAHPTGGAGEGGPPAGAEGGRGEMLAQQRALLVKGVVEAPADEHEEEGLKAFNDLEKHLSA